MFDAMIVKCHDGRVLLRNSLNEPDDPKPEDICKAFRDLVIEAGYVHTDNLGRGRGKAGEVNKKALAELLQQNVSTIWTWCTTSPPRLADLPWIERQLQFRRGTILERAGFVRPDLISVIESEERITPDLKTWLLLYTEAAFKMSSPEVEVAALHKTSLAS